MQTSARVQAALDDLSARFPAGLKARVFYDSSSFVSSTINEVVKTLLDRVRAGRRGGVRLPRQRAGDDHPDGRHTGQPDRHVRRAAGLWLFRQYDLTARPGPGIGVVVDDAIVVVENVERVMEEEPELSPSRGDEKSDEQITGPVIAISLVLLSVFVPVASFPVCPALCSASSR